MSASDWYKDAVVYQVHVKAYQDANGDGIGDFAGLMSRLDHIQSLGATAVWLLPFYPSPMRDDGYDIAEYKAINPAFGTMEDFGAFVAEAHARGLKVITELVINHTSDRHEWFQRARNAPKGSPERDFYVWSDDPDKWMDTTRVIFNDTHDSNWAWDPVAGQYYWHRFFDHQPDLNFDNPLVMEAVLDVMHFWLDKGVDGLRLDAIPYLVERDGTNNENLPETHAVLKAIRADLDAHYEGRMLLAEANQWPEDTIPYFGDGDECHMGFHFPVMPRMYMALAQEDRHSITDILRQTPAIPENCQWAVFLRNHDELTLEMVTEAERAYLWDVYAPDKRARINMGIRRRLAPLMEGDRRRIELMNGMLLALPGTPIVYYGDEIGMGDNYFLSDRDGVRTPMQWSADRNGGFSRADPQRLYLPAIQDPVYGYQARNVEAEEASPASLLNWIKRMIRVRQRHPVFGRGTIRLLYPRNRKVLAFVRETEDEAILFVGNVSRQAQAAEIDLSPWKTRVPVEMMGETAFPPIGDLPYLLTLQPHGFYWFRLAEGEEAPDWHEENAPVLPDFLTLTTRDGTIRSALAGETGQAFLDDALPAFLALQRWYAGKDGARSAATLTAIGELDDGRSLLTIVEAGGASYFLPLSADWGSDALAVSPRLSSTLGKLRRANRVGALIDGVADKDLARRLLGMITRGDSVESRNGILAARPSARLPDAGEIPTSDDDIRLLAVEQSNASVAFGDAAILKVFRRLRTGENPEIEVTRFLTEETDFDATPALLGTLDHEAPDGSLTTLAALSEYRRNQGDAWTWLTEAIRREADRPDGAALRSGPLDLGEALGRRTAEMHIALASGAPGSAFSTEPLDAETLAALASDVKREVAAMLDRLAAARDTLPAPARGTAGRLLAKGDALAERIDAVSGFDPSGGIARIHGDYHLGQVLVTGDDVTIIDFEGEPTRSLAERRARTSPLRDVAGMLRSFDYALHTTAETRRRAGGDPERAAADSLAWRRLTSDRFREVYFDTLAVHPLRPQDPGLEAALLDLFVIQKAAYEVGYELSMRPDWVSVPIAGLLAILEDQGALDART